MRKNGFTLIELLVVVVIIVILIAILLPAMGHAKQLAQRSSTEALMTNLSTSIETYNATFHAYPGPADVSITTSASSKISGSQNLLLGMSYSMVTSTSSPPANLPGGSFKVEPNKPGTVINYANQRPDGSAEQFSSFYDVTFKQLSNPAPPPSSPPPNAQWLASGVIGAAPSTNQFTFPVIVDTFSDALPILYYRRTPGVDKPSGNVQVAIAGPYSAAAPYAYYFDENLEYTTATALQATSGAVFDETKGDMGSSASAKGPTRLNAVASSGTGTNTNARGGFVLISAGIDRLYGNSLVGAGKASDDIIRVGGN